MMFIVPIAENIWRSSSVSTLFDCADFVAVTVAISFCLNVLSGHPAPRRTRRGLFHVACGGRSAGDLRRSPELLDEPESEFALPDCPDSTPDFAGGKKKLLAGESAVFIGPIRVFA